MPLIAKYGWIKDEPDRRDHPYIPPAEIARNLPPLVDLRRKFPRVYNQGNMNSCHDDQTEVLTDSGFKLFSQLTGTELLATVDPATSVLSFEKPSRLIVTKYKGPMICANNYSLNFKVTPEHKMLVKKWDESRRTLSNEYTLVDARGIGWYCGLMNRVAWAGDVAASETFTLPGVDHKHLPQRKPLVVRMSEWLRFLGIYLAEGTILEEKGRYKIQIAASKPKTKMFVRRVLSDIAQNYLELEDRFTFENRRLYETLEGLGLRGIHAPQKFVPEFVFHQSAENIKQFLLGHWMGDGSECWGVKAHHTSSIRLASDLQRAIFLSGDESSWTSNAPNMSTTSSGTLIVGHYEMHRVSVKARKNLSIDKKEQIFLDDYDGFVYCAEVPKYHTLVTRRQGKILISGNCTANAIAAAMEFDEIRQKVAKPFVPSRLFIYYNERAMEGTVNSDSGAQIRNGIKSVAKLGSCHEREWPYLEHKLKVKPTKNCFLRALKYKALEYQRLKHDLIQMKSCLASGFPFVFGIKVYSSFEDANVRKSGHLHLPKPSEKFVGKHAVIAAGYDDSRKWFIARNSWGESWGIKGYFTIPYTYLLERRLSADFWTIRVIR